MLKTLLKPKKQLTFVCCANCEEFDPTKPGYGFCPGIYWPYDLLEINEDWFCKNFVLARKYQDKYRVDKKSRPAEQGIIEQLKRLGVKSRSAMNTSDCVMLTSTSNRSSSNAVSGVDVFCGIIIILFFLFLFIYWLVIK